MTSTTPTIDSSIPVKNDERVDLTNQIINGYRVLHRLGSGGMADVYLAFHEQLQRHVALKVMRADLSASKDHIQRFLQEARAAASLIHPNIVQVYDIGNWERLHYIAQEYIAGNTLRSFVSRRNSLSQPETMSIMTQIGAALQKAASIGVVHRDIKPDNVLLTPDGEVKVADFGLARARSQTSGLTEIGVALGTPTYMSPEQIQGHSVDARSDLYSLGATAYEMLAGRPPFEGETALALALQHLQNQPKNLRTLRPDVDNELIEIIEKLLAKSPDDRFSSAVDVIRAVKKVADRLSVNISLDQPIPFSGIMLDQMPVIGPQTTHLQAVTTAQARRNQTSLAWRLMVPGLALLVGLISLGLARKIGTRPLVRQPTLRSSESVKTQSDIKKQYFAALMSNDPIDWRAIESKFPPDPSNALNISYNLKAWLHYAWLYIDRGNPKEAEQAVDKALNYATSEDKVIRVLANVAKSMIALQRKDQREYEKNMKLAKQLFETLSKSDQQFAIDAMPWSALNKWYQPDP